MGEIDMAELRRLAPEKIPKERRLLWFMVTSIAAAIDLWNNNYGCCSTAIKYLAKGMTGAQDTAICVAGSLYSTSSWASRVNNYRRRWQSVPLHNSEMDRRRRGWWGRRRRRHDEEYKTSNSKCCEEHDRCLIAATPGYTEDSGDYNCGGGKQKIAAWGPCDSALSSCIWSRRQGGELCWFNCKCHAIGFLTWATMGGQPNGCR